MIRSASHFRSISDFFERPPTEACQSPWRALKGRETGMKHSDKARRKEERTVKAYFEESKRDGLLGKLAKKAVSEWYKTKHPKTDPDEIAFRVRESLLIPKTVKYRKVMSKKSR